MVSKDKSVLSLNTCNLLITQIGREYRIHTNIDRFNNSDMSLLARFLALVTTMVTKVDHGNHRSNDRRNHYSNHHDGYYNDNT